jgi:hypothetical protein
MNHQEKEELLEEAKRRYPIGTKFKSSLDGKHPGEVLNGRMYWWKNEDNDIVANEPNGVSVWTNGVWAEVTHIAIPGVINNYLIY